MELSRGNPKVLRALVAVMLATPLAFAQADLWVAASHDPACDPCPAGGRLTLVQTVTNAGPSPDAYVLVQLATAAWGTTVVEDSWTTTQGSFDVDPVTGAVVFLDDAGLAYIMSATLGVMTPGSTATLTYQVDLDAEAPPSKNPIVNSPPELAGAVIPSALPVTGPAGTDVWGISEDWWTWGDVTGDAEWVDSGGQYAQYGCDPLIGFTPGRIAMVFRGPAAPTTCQFGTKALNAQNAGAIGVVIVSYEGVFLDGMAPGDDGGQVTIPVVAIPYEDGTAIKAVLDGGGTVNVSMPGSPAARGDAPWLVTTEGTGFPSIWAFGNNDPDCCPLSDPEFPACCSADTGTDNLLYSGLTVTPAFFFDGFESGDLLAWSGVYP